MCDDKLAGVHGGDRLDDLHGNIHMHSATTFMILDKGTQGKTVSILLYNLLKLLKGPQWSNAMLPKHGACPGRQMTAGWAKERDHLWMSDTNSGISGSKSNIHLGTCDHQLKSWNGCETSKILLVAQQRCRRWHCCHHLV